MMNEDPTRETLVLEGQTWVQCENPKCLKWRAICRLHAASLGPEEPWYCYLNPNVAERDCRVPAGPQPSRQDLKRSKLTYVYSEHVEGSLVVAKLLGYPRWPAIISADTASGEYVSKNERGVVESYHVTFLGHPRTVSWIKIQDVEPFGKIGLQVKGADKFARWWKCAMKEANGLRSMSLEERLKCCTDPDVLCSDTLLPEKKNRKSKKQRLRVSSLDEKRFQEEVCMLLKQKNLEPICSPLQGRRLSLLLLYQEVCLAGGYTEVEKRQSKWNDIHKKLIGWKSVFGGKELSTYYRRVLLPYEKLKNGSRRTENEYSARQVEDGEYVSAGECENGTGNLNLVSIFIFIH
uniref:Zinc finger CW-type PWWP domain protein 2 n=1 Tax=Eptatretus burgeri TaxID=7764 RepID=A0A8C4RC31_EPTBU